MKIDKSMLTNKTLIGSILIIVGIVAAICFVVFNPFLNKEIELEPDQTTTQSVSQSDKISIPGFDSWTINSGETKVSANFYNPENNSCYFVISVVLDDTGETIYESKYIKPGQHLYEVELNKALDIGEYQATLHYSTYSTEDLTPLNGADVPFKLIVN